MKYFCDPKKGVKIDDSEYENVYAVDRMNKEQTLIAEIDKALLGYDIICESASEPSDIIWENRHITINNRRRN